MNATTERTELKRRNLEAFAAAMPNVHAHLVGYRPGSELVIDAAGECDVVIGGRSVYGGKAAAYAKNQVDRFLQSPKRIALPRPEPGDFDVHANRFMAGLARRLKDAGASTLNQPAFFDPYFLVVFGVGLGQHIDPLVEAVDCRAIVFAEPNFDFLYHSLETYRWDSLLEAFAKKGGSVDFIISDQAEPMAKHIFNMIVARNFCGVDGTAFFIHAADRLAEDAIGRFGQEAGFAMKHIGYFNDESLMLRNAYGNLRRENARLFRKADGDGPAAPVFVVVSGPSLDRDMAFIKENADNAVIVSGGTTLRPLMVNGIVPDIQVEVENLHVYVGVAELAKQYDLSPIRLVAASTVDQFIVPLYGESAYFFRPNNSPYQVFPAIEANCLCFPDPGILNAALSFAIDAGFRTIYLFGADLGTRGTGLHHAKDHHYFTENPHVAETRAYTIPVDANFGGTFLTSNDFSLTRRRLEDAIATAGPGVGIFNCSDGALIRGATPLRADAVELTGIAGGKAAVVERLFAGFPRFTDEQFAETWKPAEIIASINTLMDELIERLNGLASLHDKSAMPHLLQVFDQSSPFMAEDMAPLGIQNGARILFHGSVRYILMSASHFLTRAADPAGAGAIEAAVREELSRSLDALRAAALAMMDDPADVPTPISEDLPVVDELVPESPGTWLNVRRNDPCPCESGKKFKHCHGRAR